MPVTQDSYVITDEDSLYRRFPIVEEPKYLSFWKWVDGKKVPSSAAFKTKPNENGLSVDIAALTTPEKTKGDSILFGVAEVPSATPIHLGYTCKQDKQPGNDAH